VIGRADAVGRTGVAWLDEAGTNQVAVRLSRSLGLPAPHPDILGMALRIPTQPGQFGDVLLATTGTGLRLALRWRRWRSGDACRAVPWSEADKRLRCEITEEPHAVKIPPANPRTARVLLRGRTAPSVLTVRTLLGHSNSPTDATSAIADTAPQRHDNPRKVSETFR
jgi:hypothetical protein